MTSRTDKPEIVGGDNINGDNKQDRSPMSRMAGALRGRLDAIRHGEIGSLPVIFALIAIWGYFVTTDPLFLSARNISNLLLQTAVVATLALGVTIVLLLGEIDLSIAAVAGVSAAIMAQLSQGTGLPTPLVIGIALAVGIAIGVAQGSFVAVFRVPSFVVTLAGLLGFQGLMLLLLGDTGAINVDDPFIRGLTTTFLPPLVGYAVVLLGGGWYAVASLRKNLLRRRAGLTAEPLMTVVVKLVIVIAVAIASIVMLNSYAGLPLVVVIVLALTGVLTWLLSRTKYGRYIYAVGGNAEAARRAGVNLVWIRISAFALLGAVVAFGGIIGASRFASVSFNAFAGGSLLLEAIGAAVIGGTSLFGGRGRALNALFGALVMSSLSNGLDLQGASSAVKLMLSGAILLLAVTVDALARRGREAQ